MEKLTPIYTIFKAHKASKFEVPSGGNGYTLGYKCFHNSYRTFERAKKAMLEEIQRLVNEGNIRIISKNIKADHANIEFEQIGIQYIVYVVQEMLVEGEE